jgi:hypothetical protein
MMLPQKKMVVNQVTKHLTQAGVTLLASKLLEVIHLEFLGK